MTTESTCLNDAVHNTAAVDTLPPTLAALAGAVVEPGRFSNSVLIIVDAQQEYVDGILPLAGVDGAIIEIEHLLGHARKAGTPVVHVVHRGGGKLFNPESRYYGIIANLEPKQGETVIEKRRTSSFAGTQLEDILRSTGRNNLLLVGFMTHHCVSSTARAARDLGYQPTVIARATATRDLPDGRGGIVPAATIQAAALAALADKTAVVVETSAAIRV